MRCIAHALHMLPTLEHRPRGSRYKPKSHSLHTLLSCRQKQHVRMQRHLSQVAGNCKRQQRRHQACPEGQALSTQ